MNAPDAVDTERLRLRRPTPDDAAAIFDGYASDPRVTRYLGWPRHRTIDDTRAFLSFSDAEWERWPGGPYLIVERGTDRVIGGTGLAFETPTRAATGYVLACGAWRRGYATEALGAVVHVAARLGVIRLYALCHTEHEPSWRVLEKCGFAREGVLRRAYEFPNLAAGVPEDVFCYARILS